MVVALEIFRSKMVFSGKEGYGPDDNNIPAFRRGYQLGPDHSSPNVWAYGPQNTQDGPGRDKSITADDVAYYDALLPVQLEYSGEFGTELVLFLPFCNWLSMIGLLKNRRIHTYRGMRCFYDDLECLEVVEKEEQRVYVRPRDRPSWLPVKREHDFDDRGRPPQHLYPDLRSKFSRMQLIPDIRNVGRPLLVIHNKHNSEWRSGPVNFISLDSLDCIFRLLKPKFTIVYIRHGMAAKDVNFSEDAAIVFRFNDTALLERHPDVYSFDNLYLSHVANGGALDLNTFKNVIYSHCYHFISCQGGGGHHIALFSGSLLAILHRRGHEERWAYGDGFYSFMATPPPIRAICRTEEDLLRALSLFSDTSISDGRVLLDAADEELAKEFSPCLLVGPRRSSLAK
jgi:hypothetical protein